MTAQQLDVKTGLYIGGEWLGPQDVLNPATGQSLGELPLATAADMDRALEAAARGFEQWRKVAPQERAAVLHRTAALVRERAEELARLATLEEGKPIVEARGEVAATAALLDFHAGEAVRIYGRVLPRPTGTRSLVLHQPVGPVAAFCAWNFPVMNPPPDARSS